MKRTILVFFVAVFTFCFAFSQEPTGRGIVTDLVYFADAVNPTCQFGFYSMSAPTPTTTAIKNGTHSLSSNWGQWAGLRPQLANHDTAVMWFQSNSRLQFWTRSSVGENTSIRMYAATPNGGMLGLRGGDEWFNPGPLANTWYFVDVPIPETYRNIPVIGFEILGPGVDHTRYFDDLKVTNVRLLAGLGEPQVAQMDFIAASQIGYAPNMKKEFTSPVNFTSFTVVRTSDNATVFTGGAPVKTVSSSLIAIVPATVYIGDFSALSTPGRYKILAGGRESLPFNINTNVFDSPTRAVQRMLYYQRAFTAIEQPYAEGPWVHPTDISKAPAGVVKGWHDAGDLTVYMPTMTQTIYWLLETWTDFRPTEDNLNIPESGNGVPDLLDETRWGLEWIISMQDNNQNHTGGFWGTACLTYGSYQGYGNTTPNNVPPYAKVHPPTVQNTAKAVAVLAYASVAFQSYNAPFAAACLAAAQNGWTWMQANPNATNDTQDCNVYAQGSDPARLKENRSWAHASLFYATGLPQYNAAFLTDYVRTEWISSWSKSEAFANRMYLKSTGGDETKKSDIRGRILLFADAVRGEANVHPFQFATYYYWGCNSNATHRTGQFSWPAYLLDNSRTADRDAVLDNVNYIFGRNFLNIAYVSGAWAWGATRYRTEGFHQWMKTLHVQPDSMWHFPGALAGGPNDNPDGNDISFPNNTPYPTYAYFGDPRGTSGSRINNIRTGQSPIEARFTDNDSWSTNEIVISWNSVFLYSMYAAKAVAHNGGTSPALPRGTFRASPDSLPQGGGSVTLTWTSTDAQSASINQNVGNVALQGSAIVTVGADKTFTLTLVNAAGTQAYVANVFVPLPGGSGTQDITSTGTPIALVTNPTGSGSHDIEVIRDGITPTSGSTNPTEQYDTYDGTTTRTQDWIGYQLSSSHTFVKMVFQEGVHLSSGGWFTSFSVQVRTGGQWVDVSSLQHTPAYGGQSLPNYTTYTFDFSPITGDAIRLVGTPGGSSTFVSVAELRVMTTTATTTDSQSKPKDFALNQNYPNPFNPSTEIELAVPATIHVRLSIFNVLGQEIRTLVNDILPQGKKVVTWDGRDNSARPLPSGTYVYRMSAGDFVETRKMLLLK